MTTTNNPVLTGRELDAAIAERVMGWEVLEVGYFGSEEETPRMRELAQWMDDVGLEAVGTYAINVKANFFRELSTGFGTWSPSSDIAAAIEVVEKMFHFPEPIHDAFLAALAKNCPASNDTAAKVLGWALSISNKPEWICRAALDAISGRKPEVDVISGDIIVEDHRGLGPRWMPHGLAHEVEPSGE